MPLFGINIAFVQNGIVKIAGIYLPATDELCIAEQNKDCTLNNKKVTPSHQKDFVASYGIGPITPSKKKAVDFYTAIQKKYIDKGPWINAIASPAISAIYLADGRRDWYVSRGSKTWDYAAPSLILKEAGCTVTNSKGEAWKMGDKELIASNGHPHEELITFLS